MLRVRLGAVLQRQRQRLGLTQAVLAERADLSLKYLGEIERGEANATIEAIERVAAELQWDPWGLFSLDRQPISQGVHQLLTAELAHVCQRLQALGDWLAAFDPALRPPVDVLPTTAASLESHERKRGAGTSDGNRVPVAPRTGVPPGFRRR